MSRLASKSAAAGAVLSALVGLQMSVPPRPAQTRTSQTKAQNQRKSDLVSDKEWGMLSGALGKEEWPAAVATSKGLLGRLRAENSRRQLAQLRYIHIFALAGLTNSFISAGNEASAAASRLELEAAIGSFKGMEFVAPVRTFEVDCSGKVNFICPVRGDAKALRVTTTTKDSDAILSFEYYRFTQEVGLATLLDRRMFLSGKLEKAEFNDDASKPWVVRMSFGGAAIAFSIDP